MKPKITFDTKATADENIFKELNKKLTYTFYVKIEADGAGTNDWLSIILDECRRVRDLNGVRSISSCHSIFEGDNASRLCVNILPVIALNGTYICPVPSQLFQAIIVSINETDRVYKKYKKMEAKISSDLAKLEASMLATAKTSKETKA